MNVIGLDRKCHSGDFRDITIARKLAAQAYFRALALRVQSDVVWEQMSKKVKTWRPDQFGACDTLDIIHFAEIRARSTIEPKTSRQIMQCTLNACLQHSDLAVLRALRQIYNLKLKIFKHLSNAACICVLGEQDGVTTGFFGGPAYRLGLL